MRSASLAVRPLRLALLIWVASAAGHVAAEDCRQRPAGVYDPAGFAGSETCAACHPQHYDEWQGSAHAYAVADPVFWYANEASYETNGIENFCITCHSPIQDLADGEPDSHASAREDLDPVAQNGVDCETCHRIFDVTNGVKQLTGCEDHYFGPIADPAGSPHGAEYADAFQSAAFCKPCHDVNLTKEPTFELFQIEFTSTEWEDANAAAGGTAEDPAIATCQGCHMASYAGPAAKEGPEREVHHHQFPGVDVALLPFADSHRQYRATQDLLRSAGAIDAQLEGRSVRVDVTNLIVGHDLPSGSAHARAVWVHLRVVGADGTVHLESGDLDANGDLRDANSEFDPYGDPWISNGESVFRQYMYDEHGDEVVAAYGLVTLVQKDMLTSGEVRSIWYDLADVLPADAAWPVQVDARLLFRPAANFILREIGMPQDEIDLVPTLEIAATSLTIDGEP
ncbi:MAG: multiheme c-type cytochrome [Pseudomonadota bacterium]|nr:multiheme c-type cytochrome [Pseudomonadota bacterium]